jgi:hypothetical protein
MTFVALQGIGAATKGDDMVRISRLWTVLGAALLPFAAHAQEGRDLCPDRPGLNTPACTVEPGRVVAELGLGDWTHEKDASSITDTVVAGDALLRVGLTDRLEAQLGWAAYGHVRTKDRLTGAVTKQAGVGDMLVGFKWNLRNPDGSGLSVALLPSVMLPTGGSAIGAGDWGAGLVVPVSYDLGHGLSLALSPELDAAVDGDGKGRHLAYGAAAGMGLAISKDLSGAIEAQLIRDDDPDGHVTQALAGLSFGWKPTDDMQLDVGVNVGLNQNSPDRELYVGVVRRF